MNDVSLLFSKLIPLGCGMDIILIRHIFSVDTIFDMASVIFAEEMSQDLSRLSLSLFPILTCLCIQRSDTGITCSKRFDQIPSKQHVKKFGLLSLLIVIYPYMKVGIWFVEFFFLLLTLNKILISYLKKVHRKYFLMVISFEISKIKEI